LEEGFSEKYTRIAEKTLIIGNMVLKLYIMLVGACQGTEL
jgi:hypothetical protein